MFVLFQRLFFRLHVNFREGIQLNLDILQVFNPQPLDQTFRIAAPGVRHVVPSPGVH